MQGGDAQKLIVFMQGARQKNTEIVVGKAIPSFRRRYKLKSGFKKIVSYVLICILCVSSIVAVYDNASDSAYSANALFTNVTGEVDLSSIALKNLSSSAMVNTASNKTHTVIVSLEGKNLVEEAGERDVADYAASSEGKAKDSALRAKQDNFLNMLSALGIAYTLKNRYTVVDNAVAIEINTGYVSAIKKLSGVSSVCLSETYAQPKTVDMGAYASADEDDMDEALKAATAVVNKTSVYKTGVYDSSSVMQQYGYAGSGSVVAIVDTGLDYTHNAFIWDDEHESKYSLSGAAFDKAYVENVVTSKNTLAEQRSALQGQEISVNDLYISQKVPFAYDYADNDTDVYPSFSNHGTHVAGIVAGYDPDGYTDKDGNHVEEAFVGVAPQAQLVICKVFTDDLDDPEAGGADTEDILAALEDCILLGVDVINMSLGTSCGFSTTDDGDEEGEMLNRVYNAVGEAGISLVCAASNDYSSAYGGTFGTNLASNPDSGTVGSPSIFAAALSVASISGKNSPYMIANGETPVYYEESSDQYNKYYDFAEMMLAGKDSASFTYVSVPGTGSYNDYNSVKSLLKGNIALVKRGNNTFKEKVELAKSFGAIGIIVYNNAAGTVRMALGEVEDPIPSCCISMEVGEALATYASRHGKKGTITVDKSLSAGPFMSEFSSWGCTPDLKLKPEITAHGGEITSAVPGGYGEQSGTSMASPNMAGVVSIIRSYLKTTHPTLSTSELTQRINQLIMSTASIVYDRDSLPYSPRKQGAGLGSLDNAISSRAYLFTDDASIDYRPKVNLGDDPNKTGVYNVTFKIKNFDDKALTFALNPIFMTEKLAINNLAVAEQAHILDDVAPQWSVKGSGAIKNGNNLSLDAGAEAEITVTLTLSTEEQNYINKSFENGMYVEGFINLISLDEGQCDLNLPFLGFYGDWAKIPMLDYSAYEIDEALQDSSIKDEEKPQASIWATQPYTTYYNDNYSMPMGSFAYLQNENADRIYTVEEHNAVSCYDNFYGDDAPENYLTTYEFRGLYLGLMRGARTIKYSLKNDATGEIIYENTAYRINKAFSGGGSAQPGFLKFELNPLEYGLVSNGKYRMDFEFFCDYGDKDRTEPDDTFSFTFYADYEAPSLQAVRVRYQDYKDGNKVKQRIYLDMDVYDNHYSQAALLCYYDIQAQELKQVTDYVVPFYNCVKNSTNTVSIEITDIYEKYKGQLYVQFDDYALNHAVYYLDLNEANESGTSETFELAPGEESISLDIYQTHKVSLIYSGDANVSNFTWASSNRSVADVKNGEIVGFKKGTAKITVDNGSGKPKTINVTVSDKVRELGMPSLSFETIVNSEDRLTASEVVSLYPDQDITLEVITDPWYYPSEKVKLRWVSNNTSVVTVDQNGKLNLIKKGVADVFAYLLREDGSDSSFSAHIKINVLDPFVISGYSLTEYRGKDKVVEIPDDKMVMYIAEDAFKDNSTMEELVIPKTVININEQAFYNCTALKRVYLVSRDKMPIPDADLKLVYRSAFEGCTALEMVDLTNVKVITLAVNAFKGCSSLSEIKNMKAIGTAFSGAFDGCSSLTSVDLTGMQVAGVGVFRNCSKINDVQTGRFTAIGDYMFEGCDALKSIVLNNTYIGTAAFAGCKNLSNVTINGVAGESYVIGNEAFNNSGLKSITFGSDCTVRKIGDKAFAKTKLTSILLPNGLTEIGANTFAGTVTLSKITLPASFSFENIVLAGGLLSGVDIELSDESKYSVENGVLYNKDKTILYAVIDSNTTAVSIPATVTEIYDYAFASTKIKSIDIPASVTKIGAGAFKDSKLENINLASSGITEIKADTFNQSKLLAITLPTSVNAIGANAFAGTLIESIDLSKVVSIGANAFANCQELATVTITDTLKSVGDYAFTKCASLDTINLPAVTDMGEGVFVGSSVKTVIFGDAATSLGEFTFYSVTSLKKVVLGQGIEEITEMSFIGCTGLEEVDLGGVTEIGDYAFANCSKLSVIDFANVVTIGEMSFYNCNALVDVNLTSATTIGMGAFCMDNGKGGIQTLTISVAQEIAPSAFEGTDIETIRLPESLKQLGFGAFAYAAKLETITVDEQNEIFFINGGVLYKNLLDGGYELVTYPIAMASKQDVYTVLEGTVRVEAYAFAGLDKQDADVKVTKVIFPYTLANIGDSAFFESGITEYLFTSTSAPVLETVYKSSVEDIMTEHANMLIDPAINAFYYSNFNTLFVYYTDLVGQKSELVMNRPSNGTGYDNVIYSRYFGVVNKTNVVMDDNTRAFISMVDAFVSDATMQEWIAKANSGDVATYKKDVEKFASEVIEARRLYNNTKDADQLAFIGTELVEKLQAVEVEMRAVKKSYGIKVSIKTIVAQEGSYKKNYVVGETFDPTGLKMIITYDDGSTEEADMSLFTLLTTGELQSYFNDVEYLYSANGESKKVYVGISVSTSDQTQEGGGNVNAGGGDASEIDGGMIAVYCVCGVVGAALIAGAIVLAVFMVRKKKKALDGNVEEQLTEDNQSNDSNEETSQENEETSQDSDQQDGEIE